MTDQLNNNAADATGSRDPLDPIPEDIWQMEDAAYTQSASSVQTEASYSTSNRSAAGTRILSSREADTLRARQFERREQEFYNETQPRISQDDPAARPGAYVPPSAGYDYGYTDETDNAVAMDRTVVRPQIWSGSQKKATSNQEQTSIDQDKAPHTSQKVSQIQQRSPRDRYADETYEPRPFKHAKHGCLSVFLWLIMVGVLALMALRMLPLTYADGRAVPELVSFVPWLFIPIVICIVFAFLWRRRLLIVVTIVALGVLFWWHRGYFLPGNQVSDSAVTAVDTAADTTDGAARIMTLNTLNGSASAEDIVRICQEQHVEILCLQELTDDLIAELSAAGIDSVLPYHVVSDGAWAIDNGGRNGIWSLAPMSNISTNLLPIDTSAMPAADIQIGNQLVRIVSVHPNSPVRGAQDVWEEGLSVIGSLSDYDHAYLIMGDFNSTWDHAHFRQLLGTTFVDAGEQSGQGFHMTYPSNSVIPPAVEIDHMIYMKNAGIVVSDLKTVKVPGTDHMALLGVLEATS